VTWTAPATCGRPPRPRAPHRPPPNRRAVDVLLDAFALRFTERYVATAAALARALKLVLAINAGTDLEAGRWLWLVVGRASAIVALELWDAESWHGLADRLAQFARDRARSCTCSSRSASWPYPIFSPVN